MALNRYKCWIYENGAERCMDLDSGILVVPSLVKQEINDGDAIFCDQNRGLVQLTSLRNEVYYEDSSETTLTGTDAQVLGVGLDQKYIGTRDSANKFTGLPPLANYAKVEIQGVDISYVINSNMAVTSVLALRDSGNKAFSGDVITLESRDDIIKFQFTASEDPVQNLQDAKVIVTYYNNPDV